MIKLQVYIFTISLFLHYSASFYTRKQCYLLHKREQAIYKRMYYHKIFNNNNNHEKYDVAVIGSGVGG